MNSDSWASAIAHCSWNQLPIPLAVDSRTTRVPWRDGIVWLRPTQSVSGSAQNATSDACRAWTVDPRAPPTFFAVATLTWDFVSSHRNCLFVEYWSVYRERCGQLSQYVFIIWN